MQAILQREIIVDKSACRALAVAAFVVLTALGAFVRIPLPFTPVPLTLQTFFVLLAGAFLGSNLGSLSQASYILLGVIGIPLFTNAGSGATYLFGPTGGYLAGFVLSAFFLGVALRQTRGFFATFLFFVLADFIILGCGMLWLRLLSGYALRRLFLMGFVPFVAGDIVKAYIATGIYRTLRVRVRTILE